MPGPLFPGFPQLHMGISMCSLWTCNNCNSLLTENDKPIYTVICEQAKITWLQGWLFLHTWNKKNDRFFFFMLLICMKYVIDLHEMNDVTVSLHTILFSNWYLGVWKLNGVYGECHFSIEFYTEFTRWVIQSRCDVY